LPHFLKHFSRVQAELLRDRVGLLRDRVGLLRGWLRFRCKYGAALRFGSFFLRRCFREEDFFLNLLPILPDFLTHLPVFGLQIFDGEHFILHLER
jgi:hypothetical protein